MVATRYPSYACEDGLPESVRKTPLKRAIQPSTDSSSETEWTFADFAKSPDEEWEKRFATSPRERKLEEILKYLADEYDIKTFYYPGSGFHQTPKRALGIDKVVHLSLETDCTLLPGGGYFGLLGKGIKVKGDYRYSPFKDKSFDAVFIYGTPLASTMEALWDYRRVVKDGGLIIVGGVGDKDFELISSCLGNTRHPGGHRLKRIFLPHKLEKSPLDSSSSIGCVVYKNKNIPAKRNLE